VYGSVQGGTLDLWQKPAGGPGAETVLLTTPEGKVPVDWSPDGKTLLYRVTDPKTGNDVWALPMDGDRKPYPILRTSFEEREAQFSPDGKWIAYQSDESGRFEIYIQPFAAPGREVSGKWQVSTGGGAQVRWRHDGEELFYIALDGRLMAAAIRLDSVKHSVDVAAPTVLFATRVGGAVQGNYGRQQYVVAPNGQRFLMGNVTEEAAPISVIVNWKPRT
jgi:hypothetical protein